MIQHKEKISENNTAVTAANLSSNIAAVQLKDNREHSVVQKKLSKQTTSEESNATPIQKKANKTGLPDNLKSGIENLSGHTMDDVKVHYNSSKPAQLQAHAYAQGTDIHIASGQEKHLPHEAWHVVQQKQGRVKPTLQMKGKVNVNDDKGLESEADVMGAKAKTVQRKEKTETHKPGCGCTGCSSQSIQMKSLALVQRQENDVAQLVKCKHDKDKHKCKACQQSIDDRNVSKLRQYQTPNKDESKQKAKEAKVKGQKGAIAHGSGKSGSKQSGKMDTFLGNVNKK